MPFDDLWIWCKNEIVWDNKNLLKSSQFNLKKFCLWIICRHIYNQNLQNFKTKNRFISVYFLIVNIIRGLINENIKVVIKTRNISNFWKCHFGSLIYYILSPLKKQFVSVNDGETNILRPYMQVLTVNKKIVGFFWSTRLIGYEKLLWNLSILQSIKILI